MKRVKRKYVNKIILITMQYFKEIGPIISRVTRHETITIKLNELQLTLSRLCFPEEYDVSREVARRKKKGSEDD